MHFPIIQICKSKKESLENRISDFDLTEDKTVEYNTDYYGEEYTEGQRSLFLAGDRLAELFKGIASVNEEGKIHFYGEKRIQKTLLKEYRTCLKILQQKLKDGTISAFDLISAGEDFRGERILFYFESHGETTGVFMSYAQLFANRTFWVGAIFDAHA